jgi:hypothetical protein
MLDYRYAAKGLIFFTDCNPIITTGGTYCSLLLLIIYFGSEKVSSNMEHSKLLSTKDVSVERANAR